MPIRRHHHGVHRSAGGGLDDDPGRKGNVTQAVDPVARAGGAVFNAKGLPTSIQERADLADGLDLHAKAES